MSRWIAWVLQQSLLMRLTILLLVPATGIGWMAWSLSVGEWLLTVVLLGLWGLLGHRGPSKKETHDVESVLRHP